MNSANGASMDVGAALDHGPFTAMQKFVVLMAAFVIVLDGFDGQLIGFAIPVLMQEWGVTREQFAPALAAGLIGMAVGLPIAGWLADRFGRRLAIVASVFLFGATTVAIGFADSVATIAVLRFVAGLGIGGALPGASTMTAEYTPARVRTIAITATIVCFPLGGMLAGLFANLVLPVYGWRGLFWIGGAIPVVVSFALFWLMPESPRFLVRQRARWPELVRLLERMSRPTAPDTVFTDRLEQVQETKAGYGALFTGGFTRDTLSLWMAFFMVVTALYGAFSWLPTMLAGEGLPVSTAASGLAAYNLGGAIGALGCALAIMRFGSRWPLMLSCLGASASAFVLQSLDMLQATGLLIFGLAVHGAFVNALQATMYALCAYVYPTRVRASGTAAALAFGRLGGILSAFVGAVVLTAGGADGFLTLLGTAMLLALIGLALLRRHIPQPARRKPLASAAPAAH